MAGVFHAFEGYEGTEISEETLHRAAQVVLWYAAEFLRLFTPPGPVDILNDQALKLDNWLIEYLFLRQPAERAQTSKAKNRL